MSGDVSEALDRYGRPFVAAAVALICLWSIWGAGRAGLSRFFSASGLAHGSLPAAARAVDVSGDDPEAYSVRASLLLQQGAPVEAAKDWESAVSRRPGDYQLWLALAGVREQMGDGQGALAALNEAVRLAPAYSQPRWLLGSFWLDAGRREEAFTELRRAATRDRTLLPAVINLAWEAYGGSTEGVLQAIKPQNAPTQLALARFFIEHGKADEGLKLFRSTGGASGSDQYSIIIALLGAGRFPEAIELLNTPATTDRDLHAVVTELLAAKKLNEAVAILRAKAAPERTRRAVLTELVAAGMHTEAVQILGATAGSTEQELRIVFTGLLAAKRLPEAIEVLRTKGASEKERRTLLAELLNAEHFSEAANLLRETGASEQERRTVLKELLTAKRLPEAVELLRATGASDRERRSVLNELLAAGMYDQAVELLRGANGVPEQDWHALLVELSKARKYPEAVAALRASGGLPERDRRALLSELLAAKRFADAYQVWLTGRAAQQGGDQHGGLADGGFEGPGGEPDEGFGWRLPGNTPVITSSLEKSEPRTGTQSLLVRWGGNPKPNASPPASQLVLVEPGATYQLSFAARTREIVSAGLPVVAVLDAGGDARAVLAQSPLPQGTSSWRDYTIYFTAPGSTRAVNISVQRQRCAEPLCPIFGSAWFDDFSLRKL